MATLDFNSVIRTTAGGQTTSTIVTANNIGSYAVASNATYYIGTTQNVFNRASGAQTLTGVSIDGNAATVTNGVYTTGAQTIGGTKTFSDGVVVNGATYYTFNKPTTTNYQTVALFGSASGGLFLTTDSAIIGVGAYYNAGWIATATSGRQIDFAGGTFNFNVFSGATVGGAANWGSVATLNSSGVFSATGDFRAPVFYDTNNTSYYLDAASTSSFNALNLASTLAINGGDGIRVFKSPASSVTSQIYWANGANTIAYNWQIDENNNAAMWGYGGTAWAKLLTITSGGGVGIGTSTISQKLNISGNIMVAPASSSWAEGLSFTMPTASTWGGLRWRREVANNDGNHYVGYTGLDSTDDLVFGSNNAGTQINNNIRITKAGLVGIGTAPSQKFHVSGIGYSDTDFRAPLFYDSNDTNYYIDPASTSVLNRLKVDGGNFVNDYYQSISDFTNGTLVTTDIDANVASGDSFVMNVIGKSYNTTTSPFNFSVQGYLYNSTIINYSGLSLDSTGLSTIKIFNNGGFLCFWWARVSYWNAFEVSVRAYNSTKANYNRVTNVTDSTEPVGSKKVTVTLQSFLRADVSATNSVDLRAPIFYDSNNTSYYVDPASTSNLLGLTVTNTITGSISGNAATATNVTWTGITQSTRTNYDLAFQPPSSGYAGFSFKTSAGGEAGYFLVRGTSDNDVYTAEGITLVADGGWLTLAQRTTASRGVRIMTGTTSSERLKITTAGDIQFVNGNSITYNGNVVLHAGNYGGYSTFSGSVSSSGNITATGYIYTSTYLQTGGNLIYPSGYGATQRLEVSNSANNTWIDGITIAPGGIVSAPYEMRSPIFYDSDNTAYYINGASGSKLKYLQIDGDWGSSPFGSGHESFTIRSTYASFCQRQTNGNLGYWLHHIPTDGSYMLYGGRGATDGSSWDWSYRAFPNQDGSYVEFRTSARAPIFYDRDNTSYYLDPASTSNLVGLTVANTITGSITGNAGGSSASCTGNAATATRTSSQSGYPHAGTGMFAFYNWGGSDGGTSAPSASTYTTGLSVGSNPGDQAYGFQIANNMWNTGLWTRNYNSSFGAWIRLLDSSNYVGYSAFTSSLTSTVDARAPIFYDSNNTAYYVDPASTGYSAYFAGAIQATKIGIEDGGIDCYMEITDANPVIYGVTYGGEFIFYGDKSTPASFLYYGGATVTYTLQANSSLRAPIFYDSNDTTYYIDPANTGTSLLVAGSVGVGTTSASTKLHVAGTTGLYQSAGNTYLYYDHQGVNTWRTGIFTDNTSTYIIGHDSGGTFATKILAITMAGNVGIGTTSPSYKLQVNGSFAATTKSFDIPHPTKENKRLVYASLEGPENGVYVRGKNKTNIIELPDYWIGLVHEDSLSVSLTPIGKNKNNKIRNYSVELIENNKVYIYTDSKDNIYDYYYIIHAERKDVPQLIVEKEIN